MFRWWLPASMRSSSATVSIMYPPDLPTIRQALRAMPVRDVSSFSYVDLGCGKGRSLFVAAEFPFRQIIGVELSSRLHARCLGNIRTFRPRASLPITSLHENAADFLFPTGDLVLYLFNPFGAETVQRVLHNLDTARRLQPCRVIVILLWPRCGDQVAALEGMHLRCETRQYQIFEAGALKPIGAEPEGNAGGDWKLG